MAIKINNSIMARISSCMDENLKNRVYEEFSPETNVDFIRDYIKLDPRFRRVLVEKFGIII